MSDPVTFDRDSARRIGNVVRAYEREPQDLTGRGTAVVSSLPYTQFVIASDCSQYAPAAGANASIPSGYDAYAVGYRMQYGCDVSKLPIVPDVATLLDGTSQPVSDAAKHPVLDWAQYKWVGECEDETWGRPVLINVNRLYRGYVFRGEFVQAAMMPGMLHGFATGGTTFYPWAPSVANLGRIDTAVETRVECGAGWAAYGSGHQILNVDVETAINSPSLTTTNVARVRHLVNPVASTGGGTGTFQIYFACAESPQPPIPAGSQIKVEWNHSLYRWEMIPTGGDFLVKPVATITKGTSGSCDIYAGTQGAEVRTGQTLTAYARAADVERGASEALTSWAYAGLVNNRLEVVTADC